MTGPATHAGLRTIVGSEPALLRIYEPESIAVIGASSREGTLSWWPLRHLVLREYRGAIYPVNPGQSELEGLECFSSVDAIPEGIDLAILALNAEAALDVARRCADRGFGAVLLPAQGIGESGPDGRRREREMVEYVTARGTRVAGPNSDGLGNLATGALATIQPLFAQGVESGRIAVVTQSGATAGSLLNRLRLEGIGCRLYASTGNEADLGLEDHLSYMLQDPGVEMVLSFVESIRKPEAFVKVAELAAELGKPIGLIKVGRSEQGAKRAAAHTGALAGADAVYDALFDAHGIVRVGELSELVALAKLYLSIGVQQRRGVGVMSVSGGQAGAVADAVAAAGLEVPSISDEAKQRLDAVLTFGEGFNPCDLTGEVARDATLAAQVYAAFGDEPSIGAVVYARKLLTGTASLDAAENLAREVTPGRAGLVAYAMDGVVPEDERLHYERAGVPVFESLHDLTVGLRGLHAHAASRARVPAERPDGIWPERLPARPLDERSAKQLMNGIGLPIPASVVAGTASDAAEAAASIGYPVVAKIVSPDIAHKTEIGGVRTDLRHADEVEAAVEAIMQSAVSAHPSARIEGVLIEQQVGPGVEMIAGITVDSSFGPFVLVGMGGVLAEAMSDVALMPAPVSASTVTEMISGLRGRVLLEGFRGSAPADVDALVDIVVRLSWLGRDLADQIEAIDLNPIVVHADGAVVLDALVLHAEM